CEADLLAVVATSALPQDEKTELEFVTLQFMMGGNVHLVGELQSQHTVEEFQQEVFARFPIPAFHVTSTVACNQVTSRRAERSLSLHELGCSGQQDRIYSQLIFFLCSASSLTHWVGLNRLLEMLQQLKRCIDYIPVALVGVIVQGDPELDLEQEVKALWWLKCLLDGVFCCDLLPGHEGTEQEVQVQVAVYQSGWPQRALEVKRAACQAIRAALNTSGWLPYVTSCLLWVKCNCLKSAISLVAKHNLSAEHFTLPSSVAWLIYFHTFQKKHRKDPENSDSSSCFLQL
uniref:Uncharacterized protein n=1 Tax=Terrapene triunguis TaxID=2587831 RepID=A0A674IZP4_9SAUR